MDFALIDFEALRLSWMKQFGWGNCSYRDLMWAYRLMRTFNYPNNNPRPLCYPASDEGCWMALRDVVRVKKQINTRREAFRKNIRVL